MINIFHYRRSERNHFRFFTRNCESILNVVVPLARVAKAFNCKVFDQTACSTVLFCFDVISV